MDEALHDVLLHRGFAGLKGAMHPPPNESAIMRFRQRLAEHRVPVQLLASCSHLPYGCGLIHRNAMVNDPALIAISNATDKKSGKRASDMCHTSKSINWHFGRKAHLDTDANTELGHVDICVPTNTSGMTQVPGLRYCAKEIIFDDTSF